MTFTRGLLTGMALTVALVVLVGALGEWQADRVSVRQGRPAATRA